MMSPQDPAFTNPNSPFYIDGNYYGQPVVLPDWCETGNIVHELGHDLGLWHEQTRCDRDQYIEIIWDNIVEEARDQFQTLCDPQQPELSPTSFGQYDLCSIMHYSPFQGGTSRPAFIVTGEVAGCDERDIGQREAFTSTDIAAINSIYSFVQ
jgi:hypothetical protein